MELSKAKIRILYASLDLFSKYGFEATSVNQIADSLGIKKPSLYSHFASKQDIFDCLIMMISEHFEENSIFSDEKWNNFEKSGIKNLTVLDAQKKVREQINFLIHDDTVCKIRKMLTIEQYSNDTIRELQEKRAYTDIFNYHQKLAKYLIDAGVLYEGNPEIMALEYISPISLQLYRIDRNPEIEEEALEYIDKHIEHFFSVYWKK